MTVKVKIEDRVERQPESRLPVLGQILLCIPYPTGPKSRDDLRIHTADPVLAAQEVGLGVDYNPAGLGASALLDNADVPQRVDFSVRLATDRDLPMAFSPPQVARRMRPAAESLDELGLVERLRLSQVTCENTAAALQLLDGEIDLKGLADEADREVNRLDAELVTLRRAEKRLLDKEIARVESWLAEQKRDAAPAAKIRSHPDYRKLHDLRAERDRIDALLSAGEPSAESDKTNTPEKDQ